MKSNSLKKMFKKSKVLTLSQVSKTQDCSIRTVQRQFAEWAVLRSYNKNSRYYTLPEIPKFNVHGTWCYRDILFSKFGDLRQTVKHMILASEDGLSGNEIGDIVNLLPRSFMHHFREMEGVFREKHGGVYIYFSNDPTIYARQVIKRVQADDVKRISDAIAIKILVGYIKHPELSEDELSSILRREQSVDIFPSMITNLLSLHDLLKKNSRFSAMKVLSDLRNKQTEGMSPQILFPEISKFYFYPEMKFCTQCDIRLNVLKTRERTVITMSTGPFIAHETFLYCPQHGEIHRSEDLQRLVPFKSTYGYDVLVYVGKALYLRSMNDQAIKKELKLKAINICESEIRYLGQKFIAYLTICHQQSQLKLRLKMARNGGYILHIDGTCEGDSPHLFTGMDEISGIILSSVKINSEKKEKIIPFLKDTQAKYGTPLAVVSDMGKGLIRAVEEVFPKVLFLICHFHFLRDIGKDLLEDKYRDLRNRLTKSKIRVALKNKAKDFEKKLGKEMKDLSKIDVNPELASIKTALLFIHCIFDTSSLSGYGFPFDMKHFLFYHRLIAGYEKIERLYNTKGGKPFYQLIKILSRVINDKDLKQTASFLEENETIFNELREALRITLKDGKQGLNDAGEDCDMKSISDKVDEFIDKYKSSENKYHQKMIEQINKYYEKLFADPIKVMIAGKEVSIHPQRTNNVMEQFFRYLKRLLRKKSGNISVKRSLTAMLPGTVLVKNLDNEEYLELLLDGTSGLEERFSQIDSRLFLREFSEMKSHNRKIPADAKKLIKEEHALDKIEKLFLAAAI